MQNHRVWTTQPEHVQGQYQCIPDFKGKQFQPRPAVRGRAARISLYMHTRYGLSISRQDKNLWCAWAKAYPVVRGESTRNLRVIQWQGEGAPLVEKTSALEILC